MSWSAALSVLAAATLSAPAGSAGSVLPEANKALVLIPAATCPIERLRPRLDAVGRKLVHDRRIARLVFNYPADPERNLDMLGRPSSTVAIVEVSAIRHSPILPIASKVARDVSAICPTAAYLAHERRYLSNIRTWPLDTVSPGLKQFTLLTRRADISIEKFDREWGGPHADLSLGWRRASGEKGAHYVQNLIVGTIGSTVPALDGIGEGGGATAGTPEERKAPSADRLKTAQHAQTFIQMDRSTMFTAKEFIFKD